MSSGAHRYARAIFELARAEKSLPQWSQRLTAVRDALDHPQVRAVLDNPSIALGRRRQAVEAVLGRTVGQEGVNLAKLLVAARRVDDLGRIIDEYERLADEDQGRVRATATTAVELSKADTGKLVRDLTARLGQEVRLTVRVDPDIVGGLILRVGDRVIDASVATRLQQLRRQLAGVQPTKR